MLWHARCQDLIQGELNETLTAEGIFSVLTYEFVPFGNAYYPQSDCPGEKVYNRNEGVPCWQEKCGNVNGQPSSCFAGDPICQHGADECLGDRYETCASVDTLGGTVSALQGAQFAYCIETPSLNLNRIAGCAAYAQIDSGLLEACAASGSQQGNAATVAAANTTAQFSFVTGSAWQGTPTVTMNGYPLLTTRNLLQQVCDAAGADAPTGCY